jgi:hypothetical protein
MNTIKNKNGKIGDGKRTLREKSRRKKGKFRLKLRELFKGFGLNEFIWGSEIGKDFNQRRREI